MGVSSKVWFANFWTVALPWSKQRSKQRRYANNADWMGAATTYSGQVSASSGNIYSRGWFNSGRTWPLVPCLEAIKYYDICGSGKSIACLAADAAISDWIAIWQMENVTMLLIIEGELYK